MLMCVFVESTQPYTSSSITDCTMYTIFKTQGFPQHFAVKAAALATHACRIDYVVKNYVVFFIYY